MESDEETTAQGIGDNIAGISCALLHITLLTIIFLFDMKINPKTCVVLAVLCAQLFTVGVQAQTSKYRENRLYWSEGPVSLERFSGGNTKADSIVSTIIYTIEPRYQTEKIDGVVYRYFKCEAYLDYDYCLLNPRYKHSESARKYAQTLLNICEKYARIATADMACVDNEQHQDILNYYFKRAEGAIDDFSKACSGGKDSLAVNRLYDASVADLDRAFKPTDYVDYYKDGKALSVYLGLGGNFPNGEYLGNTYGLNVGFDFMFNSKLFVNADLGISFGGKCGKEFKAGEEMVVKGDKFYLGRMMLNVGCRAYDGRKLALYPYVGIGANFVGKPGKDHNSNEASAFAFGAGVHIDIPVKKNVNLYNDIFGKTKDRGCVRLSPSVAVSNYSNEIGRVVSFNLGISYSIMATWLKRK